MKRMLQGLAVAAMTILVIAAPAKAQTPVGTTFTFQGRLTSDGAAADGPHDMRFQLFNAALGGSRFGPTVCLDGVEVVDGVFSVVLDFGAVFDESQRFLQVQVRADATAGNCDLGEFTMLDPRQALTAVPYALKVPGIDGHSLNAADGSPTDALFVNNAGNVGIGTMNPQKLLAVSAGAVLDQSDQQDGAMQDRALTFGNSSHEGIASKRTAGPNRWGLDFYTANFAFGPRMSITNGGNVGIGTTSPGGKLDVRGNIRVGASGEFFATAGDENLRIVRGVIDGNGSRLAGSGFTSTRIAEGAYTIMFTTPFSSRPSVTATAHSFGWPQDPRFAYVNESVTGGDFTQVAVVFPDGERTDSDFSFIAVGPR